MLRKRIYNSLPIQPQGNVKDAYFYVQAPWEKDLSENGNSLYINHNIVAVKKEGKYGFGKMSDWAGLIFLNNKNIQNGNIGDLAIEAMFYIDSDASSMTQGSVLGCKDQNYSSKEFNLKIVRSSDNIHVYPVDLFIRRDVLINTREWVHYLVCWHGINVKVFVNGKLVHENNYEDKLHNMENTKFWHVGGFNLGRESCIPGFIRYVKVWKYAKNFDLDSFTPDP